MELALCIVLASALVAATAGVIYFARAALERADDLGASKALVAQREGELELAGVKVTQANQSITAAAAAEQQQEQRADVLEKDITDDAAKPSGSALDRLQVLAGSAAGADPSSGSGPGSAK